jgi:hypothetical protein
MTPAEPAAAKEGTTDVAALIVWFSAVAGGLPLLAAGLIEYTSDFQGAAATSLPVSVISARTCTAACGSGSSVSLLGVTI